MKKYIVYFMEEFGGEASQIKTVLAESKEEARDKYLLENYSEEHLLIMVNSTAFFSAPQVFDNPIYNKILKEKNESENKSEAGSSDLDLDLLNSGNINTNSEIKSAGRKQYKVMTQKDKWFSQKFDPEKLEKAINAYAKEGWVVKSVCTASIPGFGGNREELIVIFER